MEPDFSAAFCCRGLREILSWNDRRQFVPVHVSTGGLHAAEPGEGAKCVEGVVFASWIKNLAALTAHQDFTIVAGMSVGRSRDASKVSLSFYGKRPGPGMRLDKLSMQFALNETGWIGDVRQPTGSPCESLQRRGSTS